MHRRLPSTSAARGASTRPDDHGLAGVDGLEGAPEGPTDVAAGPTPLRLAGDAAAVLRDEIERAGGREVCFLCDVTEEREIVRPRAVARGNHAAVLAVARDAPQGALLVHNHPSGDLEPSEADLAVAARAWEEGLGTAITDNGARHVYVVVEPPAPRVVTPLDTGGLEALLGPGGTLARLHPRFEDRPGQRRMLRRVAEGYNEGGVALVEAGTGTGKSLAYLVPALAWAVRNGEKTVVSTNTINLQSQLVTKDLPLVARLLAEAGVGERPATWALVKGRGNYLSIRRARLAAEAAPTLFEDDRSAELEAILEWSDRSEEGSLQDLPFVPSDDTWEEVRSDPDICLRGQCPHFQECFYQRSRQRAAKADVLVVNHHLLFTDLAVRRATRNWTQSAVLPAYGRVVLDEAHNLEDAATSHLGVEVSRTSMTRLLSRLDRRGKGVLSAIQRELAGGGDAASRLRGRIEERVRPALEAARAEVLTFVERIRPLLPGSPSEAARIGQGDGTMPEPADDEAVGERLDRLLGAFARLEREVGELRWRIDLEEPLADRLEGRLLDLRSVERRLGAKRYALRLVLTPSEEEAATHVRWVEVRRRGRSENLTLAAAPIELGPLLRESLFGRVDTAVLSSATLATRGTLDFLRGRLGLDRTGLESMDAPPRVVEEIVPSPFDFRSQVRFAVPAGLPDPRTNDGALQAATATVTRSLAGLTGGGLFVLFTSHRALRTVAALLRDDPAGLEWPLLVQGEGDRARLLEDFVQSGDAILLGTASFWEGVDVPGRPLRGLVIQKLPFLVPTEPVTAARIEAMERVGRNAFRDFMLPLAALRLKQGFGRLVRSRADRGAVVLLDDRILRKRYGRYLRDSLPDAPLVRGPWDEVRQVLDDFYRAAAG